MIRLRQQIGRIALAVPMPRLSCRLRSGALMKRLPHQAHADLLIARPDGRPNRNFDFLECLENRGVVLAPEKIGPYLLRNRGVEQFLREEIGVAVSGESL